MSIIIRKGVAYGTGDTNLYSTAPIGSILAFASTTTPDCWLSCNGASYLKADYPDLYNVIGDTYGSVDDTHFNVPDLRGEFLRGAGTNSHTGQGNGGTVGQHQDATKVGSWFNVGGDSTVYFEQYPTNGVRNNVENPDAVSGDLGSNKRVTVSGNTTYSNDYDTAYTTRPTNTSVNYIIKASTKPQSGAQLDPSEDDDKQYLITTRAEWLTMSANEKLQYADCIVCFTDEAQTGVVLDPAVVQGSDNPVTGDAVYNAIPKIYNITLQNITIDGEANYPVSLTDHGINTNGKPWFAFIWNRSTILNVTLVGDGSTMLYIHNNLATEVSGMVSIAIMVQL